MSNVHVLEDSLWIDTTINGYKYKLEVYREYDKEDPDDIEAIADIQNKEGAHSKYCGSIMEMMKILVDHYNNNK